MTRLKELIVEEIVLAGPMPVSRYMTHCLSHPEHGYYTTREPIGEAADFITAPEISQMFGELIGIWVRSVHHSMGRPERFRIVEFGPGLGTLMSDCLRSCAQDPQLMAGLDVELIEISPKLRKKQAEILRSYEDKIRWSETITPNGPPTVVIGNEFLDALPIEIFSRTKGGLAHRHVGVSDGELQFQDLPIAGESIMPVPKKLAEGDVFEVSLVGLSVAREIADSIKQSGGAVLLVDYGYVEPPQGPTLQAVRGHEKVSPLAEPGQVDLTSLVDFRQIGQLFKNAGLFRHGPIHQGDFLLNLGLLERAATLGRGKSRSEQETLQRQVNRLVSPDEMGTLFKVLAASSEEFDLPGFENAAL